MYLYHLKSIAIFLLLLLANNTIRLVIQWYTLKYFYHLCCPSRRNFNVAHVRFTFTRRTHLIQTLLQIITLNVKSTYIYCLRCYMYEPYVPY